MRKRQLFKEIEVTVLDFDTDLEILHKHYFFQLIYVLEGSGIHIINNNRFRFEKGNIFLLTPGDAHNYEPEVTPKFCVIDFTKSYFSKPTGQSEEKLDISDAFKRLEYIFHNQHNLKGNLIGVNDSKVFDVLIGQLLAEHANDLPFGKIIVQNIIFLLLNLIARNIQQQILVFGKSINPKDKTYEITSYLQQHIYEKEMLRINSIAAHFKMSAGHMSRYFKEHTGNTIKDYISQYKFDIIKTRLKFSGLTVSEIAHEMNFTDESHLNKVFKAAFGMTAKQYRLRD